MYGELCDLAADSAAKLAADMATNVTAKVTAHDATSMVQRVCQGCIRVRTWLHASHHCGKLELSLTNGQTITYDETGFCVLLRASASFCVLLRASSCSCVLLRSPACVCVLLRAPA